MSEVELSFDIMSSNLILVAFRVMTTFVAIITNILIIKCLSISEVGYYYIISTVAYFGSALFFVGFDFSLQRKICDISLKKSISFSMLSGYLIKALPFGVFASVMLSLLISALSNDNNWLEISIVCGGIAAANFLCLISRNILQIAGEKYRFSYVLLAEQMLKLLFFLFFLSFFGANALVVLKSIILASLLSFALNCFQLVKCIKNDYDLVDYSLDSNDVSRIFLPVSAGAILNWLHLQSYRPLLGQYMHQPEIVGAVSYLTMLGATVASASLGVLAQVFTPKQFATKGGISKMYVSLAVISVIILALLAYPASYVFLRLLAKDSLYGYEYLVSLGVIIEGGNFILGILGNHSSLTRGSFIPSLRAGLVGFITFSAIIFILHINHGVGVSSIGFALAFSQLIAVVLLLHVLLKK